MKFKPAKASGGVVVETRGEEAFPPGSIPEIHLQRILVPTDFSDCSQKAVQYGFVLAKQFRAELLLMHVVEAVAPQLMQPVTGLDPIPGRLVPGDMTDVELVMRQSAEQKLSDLQGRLDGNVAVRTILGTGGSHAQIVETARTEGTDLIILGTHGRTGLKRAFLGSTAEKVVRHAPCPVMVVRLEEHDFVEPSTAVAGEEKTPATSVFV